jgi:CyaY protein
MTEQEFLRLAGGTLDAVEAAVEQALDAADRDVEVERQDNVLTLAFDDDSQIIINSHTAAREIWVAARAGGFHYRHADGRWVDGRSGEELFAALSRLISAQAGSPVVVAPPR